MERINGFNLGATYVPLPTMANARTSSEEPNISHHRWISLWLRFVRRLLPIFLQPSDSPSSLLARLFPLVASFFGLVASPPPADDDPNIKWHSYSAQQESAIGYPGVIAVCKYQFLLFEWQKEPDVRAAWKEMAEVQGLGTTLMESPFMWSVLDRSINNWWPLNMR